MTQKGAEKPIKSRAPITWAVSAPGEGSFFATRLRIKVLRHVHIDGKIQKSVDMFPVNR